MKIGILAFPADQKIKLQRILSLSKAHAYELVETPDTGGVDFLIAFGEEGLSLCNDYDLPRSHILVASRVTPPSDHPHLKLPFISSRVLRIIDGIVLLDKKRAVSNKPEPVDSFQNAAVQPVPADKAQPEPTVKPQQPGATFQTTAPMQPAQPATHPIASLPEQTYATLPALASQVQQTNSLTPSSTTQATKAQAQTDTKQHPTTETQPSPTQPAPLSSNTSAFPQPEEKSSGRENLFKKYDSRIEEAQRQKAQQDAAASSMEYSVLVVDDSHAMQQVLASELAKLEQTINVDFADDGESALAKVVEENYDYIFLDIMMPGIDGFETCTQMRALPNLKKTPIIMLSSKTSPLDEVKGIMAGSSTYLTKPIDSDEFLKVIKRVSRWITEFKK